MTIKVEDVLELISSQDFADWYNQGGEFRDWLTGLIVNKNRDFYEEKNACLDWLRKKLEKEDYVSKALYRDDNMSIRKEDRNSRLTGRLTYNMYLIEDGVEKLVHTHII